MNEAGKFESEKAKLETLCDENKLVFHFYPNHYPIQMTFQPLSDIDSQMTMLEREESYISPDAKLTYIMQDGDIEEKTEGRAQWPKSLKDKLLRSFKTMHLLYLEFFHRNLMERNILSKAQLPQISEDDIQDEPENDEAFDDDELQDADSGTEDVEISILADNATNLVRMENKASVALIMRRMDVEALTAEKIIDELIRRGVITNACTAEGVHAVLPYDEPDDEG